MKPSVLWNNGYGAVAVCNLRCGLLAPNFSKNANQPLHIGRQTVRICEDEYSKSRVHAVHLYMPYPSFLRMRLWLPCTFYFREDREDWNRGHKHACEERQCRTIWKLLFCPLVDDWIRLRDTPCTPKLWSAFCQSAEHDYMM